MKANGAPEKIYISTNSKDGTYYISNQYKRLIEYTHTDAFIEKACKWFKEHKEAIAVMGFIPDYYIEDFKKYMEGE